MKKQSQANNAFQLIRLDNKLDQNEFADLLGISQACVSKIENNILEPTIEVLQVLRSEFNIDLNIFVTSQLFLKKEKK